MNKTQLFLHKTYNLTKYFIPGAFLFALFQLPVTLPSNQESIAKSLAPTSVSAGEVITNRQILPIAEVFFGRESATKNTQDVIEKQIAFVSSRKAYSASLGVIKKHETTIRAKARANKVPEDVAIGVGLLENGGSETAKSPAGALGVYQLMPGTAKSLGLTVNKRIDERKNPERNIDAGMRYLRSNYDRFGDWGLATWAYHAGEGNVSKALQIYAKTNHNVNLKGVKDASQIRAYVEKNSITIHKLLSDPKVKEFTKKLNDDSSGYPYKVIATASLFKEAHKAREVVAK